MSGSGIQTRVPLVAMMMFSICCIVFIAMVKASTVAEGTTAATGSGSGGANATFTRTGASCDGFFSCVGQILGFLWDGITFNIAGAPWWIRVPIATFFGVTLILGALSVLGMFTL